MLLWLILPLQLFLRNQVGEGSKQGIQAAWSTPNHHVKWWRSFFWGICRASQHLRGCSFWYYFRDVGHYVMSQGAPCWFLWVFYIYLCILLLLLLLLSLFFIIIVVVVAIMMMMMMMIIIIIIIIIIIVITVIIINITFIVNIIFIISIIIKIFIKSNLLFLWGKLTVLFCFFWFLNLS